MTRISLSLALSFIALSACTGGDSEDSGEPDAEDTAIDEASPYSFEIGYYNGLTGVGIAGAEICGVIPEGQEEPCQTTDELGMLWPEWNIDGYTNLLMRLTADEYITTLYTGRYDSEVEAYWTELMETDGTVYGTYYGYRETDVMAYMASGNIEPETGKGHIVYWLVSADESALDGAVITVENDAGESVGEVAYQAAMVATLNEDLTSTTASGIFVIGNLDAGEYSLRVSHETLTCEAGFAYISGVANVVTVPVEADSVTQGTLSCWTD
jgi:hypothetical protein